MIHNHSNESLPESRLSISQKLNLPQDKHVPVVLEGDVERIVFHNESNFYTIAKLLIQADHPPQTVTIKGTMIPFSPGERIRVTGIWHKDRNYGKQLVVTSFLPITPSTTQGILAFLSSGLIKGIGEAMAGKIVDVFKADTLHVIENYPHRLKKVRGIGDRTLKKIVQSYREAQAVRNIMIFLGSFGISATLAVTIYKRYGDTAIATIKENPYALALEIHGIGFKTADQIAIKMGVPVDSVLRGKGIISYILTEAYRNGHTYLPKEQILQQAQALSISEFNLRVAFQELCSERLITEHVLEFGEIAVYLTTLFKLERGVAKRLRQILAQSIAPVSDIHAYIAFYQHHAEIELSRRQVDAIQASLSNIVSIITGGPGTGKTTVVKAIIEILSREKYKTVLAAPTGRAAKRLSEVTGVSAQTIHRLLKYNPTDGEFFYNEDSPLDCDVMIIDEISMVDIALMHSLLLATRNTTRLIFVGDSDQLPSVGAGNVLDDMIKSAKIPTIHLSEIFRQAKDSLIVQNAHHLIHGEMPRVDNQRATDFFFMAEDAPEKVVETIRELVADRLPNRYGLDPVRDIQVLTPMNRGELGVQNLNAMLQARLNAAATAQSQVKRRFYLNDKVMQIRNNYDKDVYNGDIGCIREWDVDDQAVWVRFPDKKVKYTLDDLDELTLAYAITIHKSQGSEYPCVIIPVHTQHFIMLRRNLMYTAITRGKKLVILIGMKKALRICVSNMRQEHRYTDLCNLLAEG